MDQQYVCRTVRHPRVDREVELTLDRALDGECELCGAPGYMVVGGELYHPHDEDGECAGGCLDGGCGAILGVACEACFGQAGIAWVGWRYAPGTKTDEDPDFKLYIPA